ncbi:hypothetical protein EGR_00714 [Echinococcus granulosus]|uniref:Uncharacterized protein n=1 Tax=Echinococcus granulosus TaxID=6210 RepID=W6UR29_ECHGR|nr:hypothetical protein EGR_00714 [Echinococcus granulosus]EUB64170.1 hypothetical protein EGR_00714 [Echinococcus granulosus]
MQNQQSARGKIKSECRFSSPALSNPVNDVIKICKVKLGQNRIMRQGNNGKNGSPIALQFPYSATCSLLLQKILGHVPDNLVCTSVDKTLAIANK